MNKQRLIWVQLICSDLELAGHEVMAGRPAGWLSMGGPRSLVSGVGVEGEQSS
jgi:hypothetical protein